MRRSLERSLAALQADGAGRALLASTDPALVAHALAAADPYGEVAALVRAAALVGRDVRADDWIAHRLWCAQRRAQGPARPPLTVRVEGAHHLAETARHPTLLVTPMTLDTGDALAAVAALLPDRRVVVYGEGVTADDVASTAVEVAEPGHELPVILDVLGSGGAYCTYGDFAYAGHASLRVRLCGAERAMSRGWVHLAARDGTLLLPVVVLRDGPRSATAHVREAVLVRGAGDPRLVADLLAGLLEGLVRAAGAQWLLLPTLTYEATQSA